MLIYPDSISNIATLWPSEKWLKRGLAVVLSGGKVLWSAQRGGVPLSQTGGPKVAGSRWGQVVGFGSTAGTGTTDRLDGGFLPPASSGWRSIVAHVYRYSSGGGGTGRVFQDYTGSFGDRGEALYGTDSGWYFSVYATSAYGQWLMSSATSFQTWHAIGITHDRRTMNVAPKFYSSGNLVSTTNGSAASGTYDTRPTQLTFGNRASDGIRNFDGFQGPILFFDGQLTNSEHASLARDPLQVFTPDELFVWIPDSAGGDASASLTGTAGTTSAGNAAPSISASISGVSATSAVGSVSPSTGATASLSGTASTASVGSLSPEVSRAIAGSQISTVTGALSAALSKALTGSAATTSAGTLSPSVGATATLSGTATTTTTGSLAATLSITLGGVSTTASVGTLTLPGSYSAALNANQATASIGSIAPSVSNAIGGVQSATAVGASSSAGVSRSVTGNSSSANAGALAATLSVTVAGTSTSTAVGALSVPGSYSAELGSSAVSSLVGSLTTSVSVGVSGTLATTSVGTLTRTTAVIGSQTNTAVGALTVSVTNAVTGRSVIASSGSPLVAGGSFSASLYGNILATSSGLLTVLGAIPGPGESVNLYSRLATTKTLSSRIPQ